MFAPVAGFLLRSPCQKLSADAQGCIRGQRGRMFDDGQEM